MSFWGKKIENFQEKSATFLKHIIFFVKIGENYVGFYALHVVVAVSLEQKTLSNILTSLPQTSPAPEQLLFARIFLGLRDLEVRVPRVLKPL